MGSTGAVDAASAAAPAVQGGAVRKIELPKYLQTPEGSLAQQLPLHAMPTDRGQIHLIAPTGIGDVAWIWAKLWKLAEERDVTWWFPEAGHYNRIAPYCRLVGMKFGGTINIDTKTLLTFPGQLEQSDLTAPEGGIYYVHANRHIEAGAPLHPGAPCYREGKPYKVYDHEDVREDGKVRLRYREAEGLAATWMPWLPFKNPTPPLTLLEEGAPAPNTSVNEGVWRWKDPAPAATHPYMVIHAASMTYCEGNWFPKVWAGLVERIERDLMPVCLMGAKWDEDMIEAICEFYTPHHPPCIKQSFATALTKIANSQGMIGVDSGLTIMATYYGLECLRLYPRWLTCMRGSFEDRETLHPHNRAIFMDELQDYADTWLESFGRTHDLTATGRTC